MPEGVHKSKGSMQSKQNSHHNPHSPSDSFDFEAEDSVHIAIPSIIHPRYKRFFGNHLPFYWNGDEPKFTIGPHWPIFVCIWLTSIGIITIFMSYVVAVEHSVHRAEFYFIFGYTIWEAGLYLYTALKNPGIVSVEKSDENEMEVEQNKNLYSCKACKVKGKRDCHHCSECDICIKNYVQHSRWIGKCIGTGNRGPYKLLIYSSVGYLILWMIVFIQNFVHSHFN